VGAVTVIEVMAAMVTLTIAAFCVLGCQYHAPGHASVAGTQVIGPMIKPIYL
jgi:hypothetical protein